MPASPETVAAYLAREPEDGRAASKSASALSGSNSSRSPQASAAVPRENRGRGLRNSPRRCQPATAASLPENEQTSQCV
jgi:hypothetical protein